MVPDEMEEISGCHLKEVGMKVLVARSCLRHGESGLKEGQDPEFLQSRRSALSDCGESPKSLQGRERVATTSQSARRFNAR
jgi:hypothetical protein